MVPVHDPAADESHDDAKSRKRHQWIGELLSRHQKNEQLGWVGGRIRNERCGSRKIDIAILAYGDEIIET